MVSLTHPNKIHVYDDVREVDGTFYYAMEYLKGMSLDEIVTRYGFLFQAQDGIRFHCVTGVQTCALPILSMVRAGQEAAFVEQFGIQNDDVGPIEIGRASCREKSVDLGGRRIIKKKNQVLFHTTLCFCACATQQQFQRFAR